MQASSLSAARHGSESPQRIHGVEMSEQKNRLASFASRKLDLQVVAEVLGTMNPGTTSESLKTSREQCAHAIGSQLVIAGGLDLDQLADRLHKGFAFGFEVLQSLLP